MKTGKLQLLVESLMPKANRTEDGFLCPFCEVPQKQIITHIKKNHNKEMLEHCLIEDSKEYEQELKKHIQRIRTQEKEAKKKKADPEHYAKKKSIYRTQQQMKNPDEFKRKHREQNKEHLKRLSFLGKSKLKEYKKKWDRMNRLRNKTQEAAKRRFYQDILYGPVFPCVCCRTMCFRHQVVVYTEKVKESIRAKAKAAEVRNAKSKADADQDLLLQMGGVSIHDARKKEKDAKEEMKRGEEEKQAEEKTKEQEATKERKKEEGKSKQGKNTTKQQSKETHSETMEGSELLDEQVKIFAAFKSSVKRTDKIIDTLADCRQKAADDDDEDAWDSCNFSEDRLWENRQKTVATWDMLTDNMDNMEVWTWDQIQYAKKLAEFEEIQKESMELLHGLTLEILQLLEDPENRSEDEEDHLGNLLETLVFSILSRCGAKSKCSCKVNMFITHICQSCHIKGSPHSFSFC